MSLQHLTGGAFDLSDYTLGTPQRSGVMTVLPLFGPDCPGTFVAPQTGLKLSQVRGYGNMELKNGSSEGVSIVPLHMGYIQDGAQNHCLCRSAFLGAGQQLMFEDACCVQAAQSGYLEGREQWFFILPLALREEALLLRGVPNYSKLWKGIEWLNARVGLPHRGHLEQIISRQRAALNPYQSRFELMTGQIGALFLLGESLVGIEIAPTSAYFAEVWMPLLCFCYGVSALYAERRDKREPPAPIPFEAKSVAEVRTQLARSRRERQEQILHWISDLPKEQYQVKEEERFGNLCLNTIQGDHFVGQFVEATEFLPEVPTAEERLPTMLKRLFGAKALEQEVREEKRLAYLSLFARADYLTRIGL